MPWRPLAAFRLLAEELRAPDEEVVAEELRYAIDDVGMAGIVEPTFVGLD